MRFRATETGLGPDVSINWFIYNAGPSAMEAIFAGSIDLTYVGPSPAINAYVKSRGTRFASLPAQPPASPGFRFWKPKRTLRSWSRSPTRSRRYSSPVPIFSRQTVSPLSA